MCLGDGAVLIDDLNRRKRKAQGIGAKRAIYDLIAGAAAAGLAVLFVSSELDEVIGLAHRVLVVRDQAIVAELKGEGLTESRILEAAFAAESPET